MCGLKGVGKTKILQSTVLAPATALATHAGSVQVRSHQLIVLCAILEMSLREVPAMERALATIP